MLKWEAELCLGKGQQTGCTHLCHCSNLAPTSNIMANSAKQKVYGKQGLPPPSCPSQPTSRLTPATIYCSSSIPLGCLIPSPIPKYLKLSKNMQKSLRGDISLLTIWCQVTFGVSQRSCSSGMVPSLSLAYFWDEDRWIAEGQVQNHTGHWESLKVLNGSDLETVHRILHVAWLVGLESLTKVSTPGQTGKAPGKMEVLGRAGTIVGASSPVKNVGVSPLPGFRASHVYLALESPITPYTWESVGGRQVTRICAAWRVTFLTSCAVLNAPAHCSSCISGDSMPWAKNTVPLSPPVSNTALLGCWWRCWLSLKLVIQISSMGAVCKMRNRSKILIIMQVLYQNAQWTDWNRK